MINSDKHLSSTGKITLAIAAALMASSPCFAAQYSLEYEVDAKYRYNDNVGLRSNDEVDVQGAELALPAKLSLSDERYNAYVDGEVSSTKYDESGYDSDDQALKLGGDYKFERGSVGGSAGIDRSSTTETAFLDNGVVGASADRVERYTAGVNGLYYMSPEYAFITGLQYGEADYDSQRLVDNQYASAYAGVTHQYTEKTSLQLQVNANRFENDARVGVESDGLGVQAGFSTAFTERFSISLLGGYSEVETKYDTPGDVAPREDDDSSGWVLTTSAKYQGERSSLDGSFIRRESASADGYLIVSNRLTAQYNYKLSDRSQLRLEVVAGNNGALDDRIENDRDYASGQIRYSYQLAESWYLSTTYKHLYQDRERASGDANSNQIFASIAYKPTAKIWSR